MSIRHSVIGLVEILNWMESKGFSRSRLLEGTGIDSARLSDPKATLLPREELRFCQNVLSISGDPGIMLEAGFNLRISTYGIWGLAIISSPTFGKAIELGIQFIDFTYTFNQIVFFEEDDQAGLRITPSQALGALQTPMIERDVSASFVLFKALLQEDYPVHEIRFAWPQNKPKSFYQSLFGCQVSFDHETTELRFPAEKLQTELPEQNELAMQLCKEQLEKIRPQLTVSDSVIEKVQEYLSSTPLYRTDMERCAAQLGMSSRTLRRKLDGEGASYQGLVDTFRNVLANKYLSSTNMTLEEVAERLGYSDAANFSHAYKRWNGKAPRASR